MDKSRILDWTENLGRLRSLISDATGREAANGEVSRDFLEEMSRKVGRRFPPAIRDELSADAIVSLLAERVDNFPPDGKYFSAWCYQVLKHHAIGLQRKLKRDALGQSSTGQAGVDGEEILDRWGRIDAVEPDHQIQSEFQAIRRLLDQVSSEPEAAERVDYFAVFLVQLRLILGNRLHKSMIKESPSLFPEPSELIEYWLPWRPGEYERRFKPGLPSLGQVWGALAVAIDRSESPLSSDQYLGVLGILDPVMIGVTADQWNHWTKRARDGAKSRIGQESWDRTFGRWFPERGRGLRSAGTTELTR